MYNVECAGKVIASYPVKADAETAQAKIPGSTVVKAVPDAPKEKKRRPAKKETKTPTKKASTKKETKTPAKKPAASAPAKKACIKEDPKMTERLSKGRQLVQGLIERMEKGEAFGPVAIIRYLAFKTNLVRKEVLKLAEEFGINIGTASRQFQEARSGKVDCPQL